MNKSPFKSKTMWGIATMVAGYVAPMVLTRVGIPPDQQPEIINSALTLGGAVLAVYGRIKAGQ